ncbi:MAG: CoA transferase [Deltaproteobacteria bacterium]|nr:CoA transferase [Deltaproteobacteria bacterium]
MPTALEGIRVLDLSRLLPGPFATQLLADYGAEVLKVEEPGTGDYLRSFAPLVDGESAFFLNLNRNKKSLALDLKVPEAQRVFRELARGADVVVESFRPGVMDRLGIGYGALRAENPRLVYCALTGYGQDGPYADKAGHDVNYMGLAGTLGLVRGRDGAPVIPGFQAADIGGGGLNAVLGILLALLARDRTGEGQFVDAAMVDGLAPWIVYRWAFRGVADPTYLSGEFPCYAVYAAADDRFLAVGALELKFWERLCRHVGRPEWTALQFAEGADRDRIFGELSALFRTQSRDAWARELASVDCCVTPVLELDELADHPYWQHRGLTLPLGDPTRAPLELLGFPVKLSATPAGVRLPPPRLGEHTDQVLAGLGYSSADVARIRASGAAG